MRNLSLMPWVAGGATGIGVAYGRGFHLWAGNLEHKHWVSSLLLWHCLPSRVQNWLVAGDHCPLEWVTELQVKVPEGEPVGGLSNICSSPTECFPLQSLKVLHYSRDTGTLERGLLGDVCQLPHFLMCCSNYLVAVIKWIPHTEGFMLSRISSASYETHHVGTNIYFFFLKPQAVFFFSRRQADEGWAVTAIECGFCSLPPCMLRMLLWSVGVFQCRVQVLLSPWGFPVSTARCLPVFAWEFSISPKSLPSCKELWVLIKLIIE